MANKDKFRSEAQARLPTRCRPPLDLNECMNLFKETVREKDISLFRPIPTGFPWLDERLNGGLHAPDLCLFGGKQNLGKTAGTLQIARNIAANRELDVHVVYLCYEHMEIELFQRLLSLQSAITGEQLGKDPLGAAEIESAVRKTIEKMGEKPSPDFPVWDALISYLPSSATAALAEMTSYMSNLWLITGIPNYTHTEAIRTYLQMARDKYNKPMVLFVDYLQRVPVSLQQGVFLDPKARIEHVVRELDGIGKEFSMPVVAVAAADEESLRQGRVHIENLFGSNAMQYDPSVCMIINYDSVGKDRFSLEKNRRGPTDLECVLPYDGPHYRFLMDKVEEVPDDRSWQAERHGLKAEIENRQRMLEFAEMIRAANASVQAKG